MSKDLVKKDSSLFQPHDTLAKSFLSNLDVARDFLKSHVPAHIQALCDFSTLKVESSSFIEEDLKPFVSDILYSIEIDKKPGLIYCTVESQDVPKKHMPLRMLRYQLAPLKHYSTKHPDEPLPLVIPIMLYTGTKSPYPYSTKLYDCFADPKLAEENFLKINLIDLSVTPDDEIKKHGQVAFLELVAKHIKDRDIFNIVNDLVELLNHVHITRDLYVHLLNYILNCGESPKFDVFLNTLIEQATSEYKEETMTIAEQLRHQGYEKGILAGIEQGMQQGMQQGMHKGEHEAKLAVAKSLFTQGISVDIIKKSTALSDQDLAQLIKTH